ncbi:MAG: tRNA glutamyl-Q(34) synthetase GluQRS [Burkholderiales bacterium]|nr:tRNA glutamyl-Q(34) synthetase GluQRS [Burkholderiales bacterium]
MSSSPAPAGRGRFAPSPSGPLHFGSLVAAVGSYLDARANGSAWLLRIDDLDRQRTVPGAADAILRALETLGMHWDEAVLYQSTRDGAYQAALDQLKKRSLVYPCACSRREIADSAVAGIDGPVYPGTCRKGLLPGRSTRAERLLTGSDPVGFEDAVQGRIVHNIERQIGDFVLRRADGQYAYQLAVVVDDAEQGITDVVRGADLLDSTPRQIYLQRLLDYPEPRYAHLPVAVNVVGEKLSKQTLARAIDPAAPVPLLNSVLEFLGQSAIADCAPEDTAAFWPQAIAGWRIARVPRRRMLPAPENPGAGAAG